MAGLTGLLALTFLYLLVLVAIANAGDAGGRSARLARHPLVIALSLGVYATGWSYYGSVGFARREGYRYLTIYLGVTLACLLIPQVWAPLQRLVRARQFSSIADVVAFRFRSQAAGVLVTLFLLAGSLPYIALQLRALMGTALYLAPGAPRLFVGATVTFALIVFAVLFGARHVTPRERHAGLVLAIAFESLVKTVALLAVAAWAYFGPLGGPAGVARFLATHPEAGAQLAGPVGAPGWGTLLLLSACAGFLQPRQFHLAFVEARGAASLRQVRWALPLLLLLLCLGIPPILWAGQQLLPGVDPDLYVLAVTHHGGAPGWLTALAFLGGVSACSAMVIVTALNLAAMCLNHLVLPFAPLPSRGDLYGHLLWARRALLAVVVGAGFVLYLVVEATGGLAEFGLVSFVATAQLAPGLVGVLRWQRATARGFVWGLSGGAALWFVLAALPLFIHGGLAPGWLDVPARLGLEGTGALAFATWVSLSANGLLFVGGSLWRLPTAAEREAAAACLRPLTRGSAAREGATPAELEAALVPYLGAAAAAAEVDRALDDLDLPRAETRAEPLTRLRERLEKNLSGLLGPLVARALVDAGVAHEPPGSGRLADQLRFLDRRLAAGRARLQGLELELDSVQRYLRRLVESLPVGVCAVGPGGEVVLWNQAMKRLTGLGADAVTGLRLESLPAPWGRLLSGFVAGREPARYGVRVEGAGGARRVALGQSELGRDGVVVLAEDHTERARLEAQLAHSARLASIGQLAAGVAHEVGNPLTAIHSVAQNLRYDLTRGRPEDAADAADRVGLIVDQVARIDSIVRSLLTFGRAGGDGHAREPVAVGALVDEAVRLVRLGRAGREVRFVRAPGADALWALGDRQKLLQVLVNLLNNAADASAPGAEVRVHAARDGAQLHLEVEDRGRGMSPEVQARLFEPFFTTKGAGEGTGLGLSLVHALVREHGGRVEVHSAPGEGTRVGVWLPAHAGVQVPAGTA